MAYLNAHAWRPRVQGLGSVECDRRDRIVDLVKNLFVHRPMLPEMATATQVGPLRNLHLLFTCAQPGWCCLVTAPFYRGTRMKIVQVANFYGPHSGGLRTTVDAVGRGYQEAGHERILVVPGASDGDEQTPFGRRITLRSPVLPAFGGYRAIFDWRIAATAIGQSQPDRLEVSDKLSLWPLGLWAKRRGLPATLLSHERIDAILSVRFPGWFPLRQAADSWNRKLASAFEVVIAASAFSRSEWDRIGAMN